MKAEVPTIVTSVEFLNQTGALNSVLFIPTSDGLFRISEYTNNSPGAPNGNIFSLTIPITYTDDLGARTIGSSAEFSSFDAVSNTTGSGFGALVGVKAGQPIVLNGGAPPSGTTYNVFVIIEDMN